MLPRRRLLSAAGARRAIGLLGTLFIVFAVGRAIVVSGQGQPTVTTLVTSLMISVPGFLLVSGAYWLSRADIDPDFYPRIARWCLAGFGVMACLLVVYHLQPGESVSTRAPPILTALASVAGLAVGINDGRARTRTYEVETRNRQLERYREYTDDVLNAIRDVFYVLETDGTLHRWNDSLCEVTGYEDSEITSMHALEFFGENDHDPIAEAIEEGFETGSVQVEAELLTKDGASIPYEFAASTLTDPDGETVLAGIGRDVTERMDRERELTKRAHQQQVVADLGQTALETDDLDELMLETARRVTDTLDTDYCKVLELDEGSGELLLRQGVGWEEGLVGEATEPAVAEASQAAYTLANDRPIVVEDFETETRFTGPELLTSHDVRSGISTVIGPFDQPWGILGTHDTDSREFTEEDITFVQSISNVLAEAIERHHYQLELEESNERLEQFAHAASHDLQEPLRMVSSYVQLIDTRYGDELDDEGREFLEFAADGADRMRAMIDGLLEYSRVESQGEPFEGIDLDDVASDVRRDLEPRITDTDAEVRIEDLPRVEGDESQLRQVFQNLVKNAIEYSGDGRPRVHVSAEKNGTEWAVSVRDEGVGIDPSEQERIFDVFHRLDPHDDQPGSGIGLALCERIVERHGGEIWVESEPGEGATFSFTLPTTQDHE
ncbi:PAS domain S-box protein [Natrarchaeobius chitinivorans]|uniref:histidine kinase n=2 Tax=Natrarchaeobius chitinivorans TaxID=1679083 RepID=A0A3N6MTD1_NATCH|nr:PAS domain S-box protein [Natrarchaeobius chitinivorans]